jgi:hypothetical protein
VLWKWGKERMVRLTKSAIGTGRHPGVWKPAIRVVIRKPGNDDYTKLEAYHATFLLSCICNVAENVVAERMSENAER